MQGRKMAMTTEKGNSTTLLEMRRSCTNDPKTMDFHSRARSRESLRRGHTKAHATPRHSSNNNKTIFANLYRSNFVNLANKKSQADSFHVSFNSRHGAFSRRCTNAGVNLGSWSSDQF
jgi:hypothetical protein